MVSPAATDLNGRQHSQTRWCRHAWRKLHATQLDLQPFMVISMPTQKILQRLMTLFNIMVGPILGIRRTDAFPTHSAVQFRLEPSRIAR